MRVYEQPPMLFCRECRMIFQIVETIERESEGQVKFVDGKGQESITMKLAAIYEHGKSDCVNSRKRFQHGYEEWDTRSFTVVPPG